MGLNQSNNPRSRFFGLSPQDLIEGINDRLDQERPEFTIALQIITKPLWNREGPKAMLHIQQKRSRDRLDPELDLLLMARGAKEPCLARKGDRHAGVTLGAFITSNPLSRITAQEKAIAGLGDHLSPRAILLRITSVVVGLEVIKVVIDNLIQRAGAKGSRSVLLLHPPEESKTNAKSLSV